MVTPAPICPTIIPTVTRIPRTQGRPPINAGSRVMRSSAVMRPSDLTDLPQCTTKCGCGAVTSPPTYCGRDLPPIAGEAVDAHRLPWARLPTPREFAGVARRTAHRSPSQRTPSRRGHSEDARRAETGAAEPGYRPPRRLTPGGLTAVAPGATLATCLRRLRKGNFATPAVTSCAA